jgi:hypothetical protein
MKSRPGGTTRRYQGRRLRRTLIVPFAGLFAIAAIAIPLAIHAAIEEDVDSSTPDPIQHSQPVGAPAPDKSRRQPR